MKVLSLLQPWATLVVIGVKQVETRSWSTDHRGELLIHASTSKAGAMIALEPPFTKYIKEFKDLPVGAIIGQVTLTDVLLIEQQQLEGNRLNQLTLEERAFGDYSEGRYAWLLSDPVQFDNPIPVKGSLRLWDFEM
jgi:hypothetical protein